MHIRTLLRNSNKMRDALSGRTLPDEIAYFLGDSIASLRSYEPISELTKKILDGVTSDHVSVLKSAYNETRKLQSPPWTFVQNILNILNYARVPVKELDRVNVDSLVYRKLEVDSVSIGNSTVRQLTLKKGRIGSFQVLSTGLKELTMEQGTVGKLLFDHASLSGLRLWESTILSMTLESSELVIDTWRSSKVSAANIQKSTIIGSTEKLGSEWLPVNGTFEGCILVGLDFGEVPRSVTFKDCVFVVCRAKGAISASG